MALDVEFLLGRKEIILNRINPESQIYNKRILVTGAAGSIGSELVSQILKFKPSSLYLVDQCEHGIYLLQLKFGANPVIQLFLGDITKYWDMSRLFENTKPQIVFHTAAYKHVTILETSPHQAIENNIFGTKILADLSKKQKVEKFIFISTDKAVNPVSVMGMTKKTAEMYLLSLKSSIKSPTQFIITRFGNVFASTGSVYHTFKYRLDNNLPITVSHRKVSRYLMTLFEAAQFVIEALEIGKGGDILVFDMGKPVLIYDLAKRMIEQSDPGNSKQTKIKVSHLGKGEKLEEILWSDEESAQQTIHSQIKIVFSSKQPCVNIKQNIAFLKKALSTKNAGELITMLASVASTEQVRRPVVQNIPPLLLGNGPVQMHVSSIHMD